MTDTDIRSLPAGTQKVGYAASLSHLVTEGDPGHDALQAVADTLSAALAESPVAAKGDKIPMPYHDLASLVRYEGASTTLKDPLYDRAAKTLVDNEADIQKADFTSRACLPGRAACKSGSSMSSSRTLPVLRQISRTGGQPNKRFGSAKLSLLRYCRWSFGSQSLKTHSASMGFN
jgi:hypothetical protein